MAIEALKEETEIIFISGLNLHKTPQLIQEAIASKDAIGPTPIVAISDPAVEKLIGVVSYFSMKDVNGFKAIKTALAEYRGIPYVPPSFSHHSSEVWKDARGRAMKAAYVTSTKDVVTLRLENGKLATLAMTRLSEKSQKRVSELAGQTSLVDD